MNTYTDKTQENKSQSVADTISQKHKGGGSSFQFVDNRPESIGQRKLQVTANPKVVNGLVDNRKKGKDERDFTDTRMAVSTFYHNQSNMVIQREKTVSGHGGLRRDPITNDLVPFTVPAGKTIVLSAPPGATLGNISLVLNTTANPDPATMRGLIKINTTSEIWKNIPVVGIILADPNIPKTLLQNGILTDILSGKKNYDTLTVGEKGSLASLERKNEFETWADAYVKPETFKEISGGTNMYDMNLTPFEPALRSTNSATQNEYIELATQGTLLGYVANNPGENKIIVNACSYDSNAPFTGFQIDKS